MIKTEVKLKNGKTVKVGLKVAETLQGKGLCEIIGNESKPKTKPKTKKSK